MPYVFVNPTTRKPTGFIFPDDLTPILEGQYQNAAMVTEDERRQLVKEFDEVLHQIAAKIRGGE